MTHVAGTALPSESAALHRKLSVDEMFAVKTWSLLAATVVTSVWFMT